MRKDLRGFKSEQCPGTSDEYYPLFITALGKTVTVRGACEPGFTKLWYALFDALDPYVTHP